MPSDRSPSPGERVYVVHYEPTNPAYGLPTQVRYPNSEMAVRAAEGLRHYSGTAKVWVEARDV